MNYFFESLQGMVVQPLTRPGHPNGPPRPKRANYTFLTRAAQNGRAQRVTGSLGSHVPARTPLQLREFLSVRGCSLLPLQPDPLLLHPGLWLGQGWRGMLHSQRSLWCGYSCCPCGRKRWQPRQQLSKQGQQCESEKLTLKMLQHLKNLWTQRHSQIQGGVEAGSLGLPGKGALLL